MSTAFPSLSSFQWTGLYNHHRRPHRPPPKTLTPTPSPIRAISTPNFHPLQNPNRRCSTAIAAGRSKKKSSGGRIEGGGEIRRQAKDAARRRSRRLSENRFYRRNRPNSNQADAFTDAELEMVGLGYDRWVRFMSKDDPNLRHPHDWYKYGRYGPYSWRGIVVGPPIRGRFSDERVTLIGEVKDHEEWEEIERFDMASDFSQRLESLDKFVGLRHYWVFVRHPKWKLTELPWQQWTLVCEVAIQASKDQRLDKWSLMGRFGNHTRAMITQCAAWMRPDIIYVKRPVYQSRFEPQKDFFELLGPMLDPETENEYPCELKREDGVVETCTYFGGLCKIVKISPKAYVDDVTEAYNKLSDEGKSRCLEFLLMNHPVELLHPYTKEWKAKLEELELGCDAPDDSEGEGHDSGETQIVDWIEDSDDDEVVEEEEEEEEEEDVIDVGEDEKDEEDGNDSPEESAEYWNEQWKKALRNPEAMESLVTKSVERTSKFYEKQMTNEEHRREESTKEEEGSGRRSFGVMDEELNREEAAGYYKGSDRKGVKKSKISPELFLRAAVRPFTYRNLVKEIVLMRHAIIDGDISFSE